MKKIVLLLMCVMLCSCSHELALTDSNQEIADKDMELITDSDKIGEGKETDKSGSTEASKELFAMDTYMTVTAYGVNAQKAVDEAEKEIERLDALLSTGSSSSEITAVNTEHGWVLSEDTSYLVERSLKLYMETDGAFDIAIYPVMEAWGFAGGNFSVPEEAELKELLAQTDVSQINFDKKAATISFAMDGMKIDLGGIAKGYTSSKIMDIYRENGIQSGLVSLGGNVQVFGKKTDGTPWRVAIQNPDDPEGYLGILEAKDQAVITSGGYERYFEQDGIVYHHIIDPDTGYPADSGLTSVTIVSADGTLADGLSTALFIMGKDKAIEYWSKHSDEFDAILLTADKELLVTDGIAGAFSSDMEIRIITGEE